jgi:hypothetical protein
MCDSPHILLKKMKKKSLHASSSVYFKVYMYSCCSCCIVDSCAALHAQPFNSSNHSVCCSSLFEHHIVCYSTCSVSLPQHDAVLNAHKLTSSRMYTAQQRVITVRSETAVIVLHLLQLRSAY